ncbi:unnamed protein product [Rhizoctonia solani]|uniref:Uncharacterized protein n=1 Tax=Rhizoctonia solani TaxID=456999 RepID=A0A8H3D0R5_9AGAM|nr:unnamed protein product [Rhizoctonia solani]
MPFKDKPEATTRHRPALKIRGFHDTVSAAIVRHPELPLTLLTVIEKGSEWQRDIAMRLNNLFWLCSNSQQRDTDFLNCIHDMITRLEVVGAAVAQYDEFGLVATSILYRVLTSSGIHQDTPDVSTKILGLLVRCLRLEVEMTPNDKGELVSVLRKAALLQLQRYQYFGVIADLDTALEYFGRLLSLDPSEVSGDLSQLVEMGENQFVRFGG